MDETNIRNYAPGEGGKFVDVTSMKYSEEKCFPHLFPEGNMQLSLFLSYL